MTQGHTPIKWHLEPTETFDGRARISYYRVFDDDLNAICSEEFGAPNDGGKDKMRFIVTACNAHYDMLEALKRLDRWFDTDEELLLSMTGPERMDHERQHEMIRAAIAKAEGGDT